MTLTLYTNPMSRGRIARWMLEEVGQPYETVWLDYDGSMRMGEYLRVNPMGKVPALRHGEGIVTEAAAICAYLADAFPEAGLGPREGERADYWRWLFFAAGPVEQALTNHAMGFDPSPEQGRMAGYGSYDATVATLAGAVADGFVAGERFTAADVYVGSGIGWGLRLGTLPDRPAFRAYWDRVKDREARLRAEAIDDAKMAEGA